MELNDRPRDLYQRLLPYEDVGDVMVNAELLRPGDAKVMTIRPNVRFKHHFDTLRQQAREERAGCLGRSR
jgi:micrococcal nuclease